MSDNSSVKVRCVDPDPNGTAADVLAYSEGRCVQGDAKLHACCDNQSAPELQEGWRYNNVGRRRYGTELIRRVGGTAGFPAEENERKNTSAVKMPFCVPCAGKTSLGGSCLKGASQKTGCSDFYEFMTGFVCMEKTTRRGTYCTRGFREKCTGYGAFLGTGKECSEY